MSPSSETWMNRPYRRPIPHRPVPTPWADRVRLPELNAATLATGTSAAHPPFLAVLRFSAVWQHSAPRYEERGLK